MFDALARASREHWGQNERLLRILIQRVDFVGRQLFVMAGGSPDDVQPIVILAPGEEPPRPGWVQALSGVRG